MDNSDIRRASILRWMLSTQLDFTYRKYAEEYNEHPERVRRWWRLFKNKYIYRGELFPDYPMDGSDFHFALKMGLIDEEDIEITDIESQEEWQADEETGEAYHQFIHDRPVKTIEQAQEANQVDLDKWQIKRWKSNVWGVSSWQTGEHEYRNNWQVTIWYKRRQKSFEEAVEDLRKKLRNHKRTELKRFDVYNRRVGVLNIGDLHTGVDVRDLVRLPDFNMDILTEMLDRAAYYCNEAEFSEVHVNILGDLVESISGLNHEDTWKSLDTQLIGSNVIIFVTELLDNFLSNINNLVAVNMVSGNHDRLSRNKNVESTGEAAKLVAYGLSQKIPDLDIEYHPFLISKEIDGINYIIEHGDKSLSKKDVSKIVNDHGDSNLFNLVVEGHWHTRLTKKTLALRTVTYKDLDVVCMDELRYRKINIPALFTGHTWHESKSLGGTAGCIITENAGNGIPHVYDKSVHIGE